jgi:type I restriction enzyme M protein
MAIGNIVKKTQTIMRNDAGVNGDAQRIEQLVWILLLKIYDAKEQEWEIVTDNYQSIIPENCKWRNWAVDNKDNKALTGEALLNFVNNTLFPSLKNLEIDETTPLNQSIIKDAFIDANNYQKDGILLRQVINEIDQINFTEYEDRHAFGAIYESFLKDLQSAGNAGEYYTPRAVTDFMVDMIEPKLGERVADFACGTGGFLVSTLNKLNPQIGDSLENKRLYNNSIYGIEKKPIPHILCVTNMFLHDIDNPQIIHGNTLENNYKDVRKMEKFDVILMNPPYGGNEKDNVKSNFPSNLRSSETADLFIDTIMFRLKKNGRCAVIIPDGFLFGSDNAKLNIKKKLLSEYNLHTIVRMPKSVFAPYTSITTNILFFDDNDGKGTKDTWFYRMDMPEGYKNFSKTKPMKLEHFDVIKEWWANRSELKDHKEDENMTETWKSKKFTFKDIQEDNYNLDKCGYPTAEKIIYSPKETIKKFIAKRTELDKQMDEQLSEIMNLLGVE